MHMTHMGNTADAEALVMQSLRTGMADGWGGSMMGTEMTDILFGTPDAEGYRGQTWVSSKKIWSISLSTVTIRPALK